MAGSAVKVTDADFQSTVLESDKPVFVDFWATWCPPCKRIAPFVEELATDYDGRAVVAKVDIDESGETAMKYGISSIPTLMVFKNGEPVEVVTGAVPKEHMSQMIDKHL